MKTHILRQAYPLETSSDKMFLFAILFGLFIFLFLLIFQPFGIQEYQHENKIWHILGYGGITTASIVISNILGTLLLPKWFNEKNWTVGKNILYLIWIFLIIGLFNFSYSVKLGFLPFNIRGLILYEGITLLVGILPVVISTLLIYQNRLKNALKEAQELNQNISTNVSSTDEIIDIPSKNKSENVKIQLNNLLYIKAVENYIELYIEENNEIHRYIIRNTLKDIENTFGLYTQIRRCHRSYLVNLEKISSFSGNAQGLQLQLDSAKRIEIPVSRSFVPIIKKQL